MPNGNTEVERRANVCFSENIKPGDVDMEALIPKFRYISNHRDTPVPQKLIRVVMNC